MIRLICVLFWVSLAVYGIWRFIHANPGQAWVYRGARPLQKNYRFGDSDLSDVSAGPNWKMYRGRYLRKQIDPNKPFTTADLLSSPELEIPTDAAPVLIPLNGQPTVASLLNAGTVISIWRGKDPIASRLRVLALLCPKSESSPSDCQVVLAPLKADSVKLAHQDVSKLTLLPVVSE